MNREPQTLRLHIEGDWSAGDFASLFIDLRDLYVASFSSIDEKQGKLLSLIHDEKIVSVGVPDDDAR